MYVPSYNNELNHLSTKTRKTNWTNYLDGRLAVRRNLYAASAYKRPDGHNSVLLTTTVRERLGNNNSSLLYSLQFLSQKGALRPGRDPSRLDGSSAASLPGFTCPARLQPGCRVTRLTRVAASHSRLLGFTRLQGARGAAAAGPSHSPRPSSLSRGHSPRGPGSRRLPRQPAFRVTRVPAGFTVVRPGVRCGHSTPSHLPQGSDPLAPCHWQLLLPQLSHCRPRPGIGQGGQARLHSAQLWLAGAGSRALPGLTQLAAPSRRAVGAWQVPRSPSPGPGPAAAVAWLPRHSPRASPGGRRGRGQPKASVLSRLGLPCP